MSYRFETFARTHLGLRIVTGEEATLLCPLHPDSHPSMRFNLRKGLWLCNACGARGNVHQLADALHVTVTDEGVSPEALQRRLRAATTRNGHPTRHAPSMPEEALKRFVHHPYWSEQRGFSQKTIYRFGLGWDPVTDMLTIPVRDSYGHLLGIIYRRFSGRPRYSYPKGFARGKSLFASWMIRGEIHSVVLVEGPLDAIALWNAEIPSVALLGSSISPGQVDLLRKLDIHRVLVMLDNDAAGIAATAKVMDALRGSGIKRGRVVYGHPDPGEMTPAELRRVIKQARRPRQ